MKQCSYCCEVKPLSEFWKDKHAPDGLCYRCKSCAHKTHQDWVRDHRDQANLYARRRMGSVKDYIRDRKTDAGCFECGDKRYYVLDFHHLDPATKTFNISASDVGNYSIKAIAAEMLKCVVLCSNCHKELHHLHKELLGRLADAA